MKLPRRRAWEWTTELTEAGAEEVATKLLALSPRPTALLCFNNSLARLIIDVTGSRSKIVHRPLPVDDPIQRCPDISLARSALDWEPKTALRPGLERTIAYFENLLKKRGGVAATRPAA